MWERFRSSPSMAVAVVSLVVALLCVLYVMERPGTIAIGAPSPNGIRVIEWDYLGPEFDSSGDRSRRTWWNQYYAGRECYGEPKAYKVWNSVEKTVPEGKVWIVIVSPVAIESSRHPFQFYGRFECSGYWGKDCGRWKTPVIVHGTYEKLDLVIYFSVPVVYLVIEVDSELQR